MVDWGSLGRQSYGSPIGRVSNEKEFRHGSMDVPAFLGMWMNFRQGLESP